MKILNFGSCNIDYVYSLHHIVKEGETETTHSRDIFPGGKGLNQSVAAARAGAQVYHAGCVGEEGAFLRDLLSASGVNTTYLQTVDTPNGHAIIQVSESGQNSIFLYPGSNEMLCEEEICRVLSHFGKEDLVLLQNETNLVEYIVEKAHECGIPVMFNPSPINEVIHRVDFSKLTYLILNEVEAQDISGCEEPETSLCYFRETYPNLKVILTLGSKGSVYQDAEGRLTQAAYSVKAVDTTAAGDTFTGYLAAGIARGNDMAVCLQTASKAAAISVSRKGAAPSIPVADEVTSWNG